MPMLMADWEPTAKSSIPASMREPRRAVANDFVVGYLARVEMEELLPKRIQDHGQYRDQGIQVRQYCL